MSAAEAEHTLNDRETSDAIHRADYPRSAMADTAAEGYPHSWGDTVAKQTIAAAAIADHVCGVTRVDSGPDPNRGTLRWYQTYIAELDRRADALAPGWRTEHRMCGPFAWAVEHFGPVNPAGDEPEMPCGAEHTAWLRSGLPMSRWRAAAGGAR